MRRELSDSYSVPTAPFVMQQYVNVIKYLYILLNFVEGFILTGFIFGINCYQPEYNHRLQIM